LSFFSYLYPLGIVQVPLIGMPNAVGNNGAVQLHAMDLSPLATNRFRLLALCLLACLAILEFSMRGPVRELGNDGRNFNDFVSPYEQTRAWVSGRDPYDPVVLKDLWPTSVRPHFVLTESVDGTLPAKRGIPSPYLTTAFPLLLPVAELPWKIAIWLWAGMCVLGVFVIAVVLIHLAGLRTYTPLGLIIFISVLLWAPVHTAIATSNIVTAAFALGMAAIFCLTRDRGRLAGILLTFAVALKPTIALPFLIYALMHRSRARVMSSAIITGILLFCVALVPPHGRTLWLPSFLENSQRMFAPGAIDDFSTANPLSFQLVNLQAALFPILQNRRLTDVSTALIFAILLAGWLLLASRDRHLGLLDLAILASLSLIPVYHRFTDAGLLLVAVVWALTELQGDLRRFAVACLLLASPFLVPGASLLHEFAGRYETFQNVSHGRFWESFLLPHEAWLILALCVLLLRVRSLPS
jgi:Glycosyltransferase family 87